jgi:hypothetical protein
VGTSLADAIRRQTDAIPLSLAEGAGEGNNASL